MGGALSAAAGGHHSLFFAGQPLKEMFKRAPFVDGPDNVAGPKNGAFRLRRRINWNRNHE
jgi:hypothetical protein